MTMWAAYRSIVPQYARTLEDIKFDRHSVADLQWLIWGDWSYYDEVGRPSQLSTDELENALQLRYLEDGIDEVLQEDPDIANAKLPVLLARLVGDTDHRMPWSIRTHYTDARSEVIVQVRDLLFGAFEGTDES